ncbi:hypothetical protein GQ457_03G007400 [Hibiscus cannabinus]
MEGEEEEERVVGGGKGEIVREEALEPKLSKEKEWLLMEMVEKGVEQLRRKEGWPQPEEKEKGKAGGEVKGGHGHGEEEKISGVDGHE